MAGTVVHLERLGKGSAMIGCGSGTNHLNSSSQEVGTRNITLIKSILEVVNIQVSTRSCEATIRVEKVISVEAD